jgi:putative tryptophan/tyrosine transport system substrate-binding protein
VSINIARRQFVAALSGAVAWPLAARAQKPAIPVIGFLGPSTPENDREFIDGFRQGLSEAGFVEGRDVIVEYRGA